MTIPLIIGFTVVSFIILIVGIIMIIPWRKIIEDRFGDKIENARVFIFLGAKDLPVNGKLIHSCKDGMFYAYVWRKDWYTILCPPNYPVRFLHGRRRINVTPGQYMASPLGSETYSPSAEVLDSVLRSNIAVKLVNSVKGSRAIPWIIIIVIAGVAIGAFFVLKSLNIIDGDEVIVPPIPPITTTPQPTSTQPIESGPYSYIIDGWCLE